MSSSLTECKKKNQISQNPKKAKKSKIFLINMLISSSREFPSIPSSLDLQVSTKTPKCPFTIF